MLFPGFEFALELETWNLKLILHQLESEIAVEVQSLVRSPQDL